MEPFEPGSARSCTFEKTRQFRKHGRRVAFAGRRFARRQTHFALRHGEARDAVHQKQNMQTLIAQLFGDGHRHIGGLTAHQRRLVGRRGNDDAARETFRSQIVLDEFLEFAAAFADEPDDDGVGIRYGGRAWRAVVDLPTPEPAKMPMRWPLQQVGKALSALTPRSSLPPTRPRVWAEGAWVLTG